MLVLSLLMVCLSTRQNVPILLFDKIKDILILMPNKFSRIDKETRNDYHGGFEGVTISKSNQLPSFLM
jgi:hypothetical protein